MSRYKKLKKIASGGQAEVYRGKNVDTGAIVALKYLTSSFSSGRDGEVEEVEEARARFIREVKAQKSLRHPNIVPIYACAERAHKPWYAMPLAQDSLDDSFRSDRQSEEWVLDVIAQILDAIEYSHDRKVIHRDLKPSNILQIDGTWRVSDFGLCRFTDSDSAVLTRPKELFGTQFYSAPEQYDNAHDAGPPADIFSIGRILLQGLTWLPPTPYVSQHLASVREKFRPVLTKCLAEMPDSRYQRITDLRSALHSL
ncbi:serine/threonine-protein kinase [Streptomyces rubiginosohelvolus]|uniref:serine/threonine-protein kinase n=1 Tax=Streptomyces rubiginosohelvolus TaxID=67362 RepID=UPI0034398006